MQAYQMLTDWIGIVQGLLGSFHTYQVNTLATLSFGWLRAASPFAIEWGTQLPTGTQPNSTQRRGERFVSNDRISLPAFLDQWIPTLLQRWLSKGANVLLVLDETVGHKDRFRRMQLGLAYRGRTIPLAWRAYHGKPHGQSLPEMLVALLGQVQPHLPDHPQVTLLADRGLAWPGVLQRVQGWGWGVVVRLQGQTQTRSDGGPEVTARQRVSKPGQRWFGHVRAFKKHGWVPGYLTCAWAPAAEQPWLLFSTDPASLHRVRAYAKRMWIEESFRDDKSHGLNWQDSHITCPERAERLLMLVALASVLALNLGTWVDQEPDYRRNLDARRVRHYSLFALGRLWLQWLCQQPTQGAELRLCRLLLGPSATTARDPTPELDWDEQT